ncbi:hypothetical protein ACSX1A_09625 [Pontibacter sp. MBLB2868]|uniref:hypothetical protein n=1 Tax=Pontibacter sp. MBLB2868 TaxID=3451555 RepID=UPI003F74CA4D
MDLILGIDVVIGLYAVERAKATYANGEEVVSKFELSTPKVDVRPRVGATVYYKRFGLTSSYAHGLTNYMQNYVDANPKAHPKAYMRVLRLGLSYKIK